jgi:hypothetical protein
MEARFSERQVRSLLRIALAEKERHPEKGDAEITDHILAIAEFVIRTVGDD